MAATALKTRVPSVEGPTAAAWLPRTFCTLAIAVTLWVGPDASPAAERPRARDIGLVIGVFPPGPLNAITDVDGVRVGHRTLIDGAAIQTGVTAILPHGGNIFQSKVPAAVVVGNGFGKLVGSTQVDELGTLETPIILTNTLSTFAAADALVEYILGLEGNEEVRSVNPVVAETNDGFLNDIRARRVKPEDVVHAITAARAGPVKEGSVGAGTGTRCLGWKGGIGTASRRLPSEDGGHTLGVLVQSNFGGSLVVHGAPVGNVLGSSADEKSDSADGSCIIVIATDAPLIARQLRRVAMRAFLGLAATGSYMSHGSGDYAIAFSTAEAVRVPYEAATHTESVSVLRDDALSPLFRATREATEEAIINSLLRATTVTGFRGNRMEAIPIDRLIEICKRFGAIKP